jgi:hypothetical protein
MEPATPDLDRLASMIDPMGELNRDERRRCAVQVLMRFERWVQPTDNGCHLWTGSLSVDGYGQFSVNGRLHLSRRLAYELWVRPIRAHERVFSTCGVRACVNYCHLAANSVALPMLPADRFTTRAMPACRLHLRITSAYASPREPLDCRRNASGSIGHWGKPESASG